MNYKRIKIIVLILLASSGFLATGKLAIDFSLRTLLSKQADAAGRDWAHYVDNRLGEKLPVLTVSESGALLSDGQLANIEGAVSEIFALGNVLQIDFIDATCSCIASFAGGTQFPAVRRKVQNDTNQDHPAVTGESRVAPLLPSGAVQPALVENGQTPDRSAGKLPTGHSAASSVLTLIKYNEDPEAAVFNTPVGFPAVDQKIVQSIRQTETHQVAIPRSGLSDRVGTVAEIYHSIERGDQPKLVLRLLVDMDAIAKRNRAILYLASILIVLLLFLSFGYPAIRHFQNLRTQRLSDEKAYFLANHDVLTGLANRNAFQEDVPKRLLECSATGSGGALFLIDIDDFKEINDFYGHHVGDHVLQMVANILTEKCSTDSLVARLGGDELAIVTYDSRLAGHADPDAMVFPSDFQVDLAGSRETFDVSFSVGIARFPRDGTELPDLMRNADLALYAAKNAGKSAVREYHPQMKIGFHQRQVLFNEFRTALKTSQIFPYYQPVVCTRTGLVQGVEALVRWNHPFKGTICASEFADVLEDREICEMVGCQMLEKVTADMARWKQANVPFKRVGFNVNAANLLRQGFIKDIVSTLTSRGLTPEEFAVEVTEKAIFGTNSKSLFSKLHELRDMGCDVVLDDFGTGYSSITHLKELPYSFIKVARTFISNIAYDRQDQAIVSSLIELGKSLNYKVVAEGIETYAQYEKVKELGFHLAQGYYFSEPVPSREVPKVIDQVSSRSFRYAANLGFHEDVA
uniref:putative bifunctional diguanylate cyclase/phosphodiesterase n=1 Tax=Pararhizobium sp. IMCC3301 TaxID=3067904 RepID=UPI0027429069|nr:EAL domain-containing protein [Pararhizobium sp. IMCC3301]